MLRATQKPSEIGVDHVYRLAYLFTKTKLMKKSVMAAQAAVAEEGGRCSTAVSWSAMEVVGMRQVSSVGSRYVQEYAHKADNSRVV